MKDGAYGVYIHDNSSNISKNNGNFCERHAGNMEIQICENCSFQMSKMAPIFKFLEIQIASTREPYVGLN